MWTRTAKDRECWRTGVEVTSCRGRTQLSRTEKTHNNGPYVTARAPSHDKGRQSANKTADAGRAEHFSACSPPGEGCWGFKRLLRYFRDVMAESAEVTTRHNTKRHNSFSKPSIVISPPPPPTLPPSLPPPSSVIGDAVAADRTSGSRGGSICSADTQGGNVFSLIQCR